MNFITNKAIYLQIADDIADHILAGDPAPEQRIPSTRDLSADYQVNINTVMRSVDYLQQKGIIINRRGIGFFVTPDAIEIIKSIKVKNLMDNEMSYFFRRLATAGITPDRLAELYAGYCSENKVMPL